MLSPPLGGPKAQTSRNLSGPFHVKADARSLAWGADVAMRYEIEVHYRGYLPRRTVIEADSNFEAREVARAWIEAWFRRKNVG